MKKHLFNHIEENYRIKFGETLNIQSQQALGGGCISSALRLETNIGPFFLKWNASGPDDLFLREAESLNEFQKSNNEFMVFPKPLLWTEIDSIPGYLLTTYLENGSTGNDDERLGFGLAQLHKLSNSEYGFYHNNYCGATLQNNNSKSNWVDFYRDNRIGYLVNLIRKSREWSSGDEKLTERFLNKVPDLLEYKHSVSLNHGDLWSGNYMYTTHGPALIDPCASYCDREFEMGIMTMFGGFSQTVFDAYNEFFPLEQGWQDRNQIYQLYHVLNHYFLFGGGYKRQALSIMKRYV